MTLCPVEIAEAEKEIEQLLSEGVHSVGWDFSRNIEVAIENGHPTPQN